MLPRGMERVSLPAGVRRGREGGRVGCGVGRQADPLLHQQAWLAGCPRPPTFISLLTCFCVHLCTAIHAGHLCLDCAVWRAAAAAEPSTRLPLPLVRAGTVGLGGSSALACRCGRARMYHASAPDTPLAVVMAACHVLPASPGGTCPVGIAARWPRGLRLHERATPFACHASPQ